MYTVKYFDGEGATLSTHRVKKHTPTTENTLESASVAPSLLPDPLPSVACSLGSLVAIAYDEAWYVGRVENAGDDGTVTTSFMEREGKKWKWPHVPEVSCIHRNFVLCEVRMSL